MTAAGVLMTPSSSSSFPCHWGCQYPHHGMGKSFIAWSRFSTTPLCHAFGPSFRTGQPGSRTLISFQQKITNTNFTPLTLSEHNAHYIHVAEGSSNTSDRPHANLRRPRVLHSAIQRPHEAVALKGSLTTGCHRESDRINPSFPGIASNFCAAATACWRKRGILRHNYLAAHVAFALAETRESSDSSPRITVALSPRPFPPCQNSPQQHGSHPGVLAVATIHHRRYAW